MWILGTSGKSAHLSYRAHAQSWLPAGRRTQAKAEAKMSILGWLVLGANRRLYRQQDHET